MQAAKDFENLEVVDADGDGTVRVGQGLPEPYQPSPAEVATTQLDSYPTSTVVSALRRSRTCKSAAHTWIHHWPLTASSGS